LTHTITEYITLDNSDNDNDGDHVNIVYIMFTFFCFII